MNYDPPNPYSRLVRRNPPILGAEPQLKPRTKPLMTGRRNAQTPPPNLGIMPIRSKPDELTFQPAVEPPQGNGNWADALPPSENDRDRYTYGIGQPSHYLSKPGIVKPVAEPLQSPPKIPVTPPKIPGKRSNMYRNDADMIPRGPRTYIR